MSGDPGKRRVFTEYRMPSKRTNFLANNSGAVPEERTRAISKLRRSFVSVSIGRVKDHYSDLHNVSIRSVILVVMGVTGCGKTTVGQRLAAKLGCSFCDGDDFHSPANVEKMRRGEALTDEDRWPWLAAIRQVIDAKLSAGQHAVIGCSALRKIYREQLGPVTFVYLRISRELAEERVRSRSGHYMPATLVASQFESLEEPEDAIVVEASDALEDQVRLIIEAAGTDRHRRL